MATTLEIPDGVTHWRCARLDKATGAYSRLLWSPPGSTVAVGMWKVPERPETIAKRVAARWGPGMYKLSWVRTRDNGKKEGAGHVEIRIEEPPGAQPSAPAAPAAAVGAPYFPPGYPYPPQGAPPPFPQMPFDPLAGFRQLFEYAGSIRGQEREDANERADRYRVETQAAIERERMALNERMADRERVQRQIDDVAKREHDLALARIQSELAVSREQIAAATERERERAAELEERLDELAEQIEQQGKAGATAGQQALSILQGVIEKVGGPLGEAAAKAISNGALKGTPAA